MKTTTTRTAKLTCSERLLLQLASVGACYGSQLTINERNEMVRLTRRGLAGFSATHRCYVHTAQGLAAAARLEVA